MNDLALMQQVEQLAGSYLDLFAPSSSVPESFWAALTANESAGQATAVRFEPGVYDHLKAVAAGAASNYGSITTVQVGVALAQARQATYHSEFLDPTWAAAHQADLAMSDDQALRLLASSLGLTQIMGYHALEWGEPITVITDPATHYPHAAKLMAGFCKTFGLDPGTDFEAMARCWNTGRPNGATWDPEYVPNLLKRMKVWDSL